MRLNSKTWFIVLNAYPESEAQNFSTISNSCVSCWIHTAVGKSLKAAISFSKQQLKEIRVQVTGVDLAKLVDTSCYSDGEDGAEFFNQAQIDGYVFNLHNVSREFMAYRPGDSLRESEQARLLNEFASHLLRQGGFGAYDEVNENFAGILTETESFMLPIFLRKSAASRWIEGKHQHDVRDFTANELVKYQLLLRAHETEMLIGADVTSGLLTCHPLWLLDKLKSR